MKKLTKLSLLALVSLSIAGPAWAQTPTPGFNDLILDFRFSNQANGTSDLEVDLGSYTQFALGGTGFTNSPPPPPPPPSAELNVSDLTSTFGSNWATSGNVVFSVVGDTDTSFDDGSGFFTQSGTPQSDGTAIGTAVSNVDNLTEELYNLSSTSNSSGAAVYANAASANSFASYTNEEANGLGYFSRTFGGSVANNVSDLEAVVTGSSTNLKLYSYDNTTGTPVPPVLQGTFTLSNSGALSYSVATAPEPSTWALMLGGAGFLFLAVRRRWMSNLS